MALQIALEIRVTKYAELFNLILEKFLLHPINIALSKIMIDGQG